MSRPRIQIYTDQELIDRLETAAESQGLKMNRWALSVLTAAADSVLASDEESEKTEFSIEVSQKDAGRIRQAAAHSGHRSGSQWLQDIAIAGVERIEQAKITGRFLPSGTRLIPFEDAGEIDRAKQLHKNVSELVKDYVSDNNEADQVYITRWLIELIEEDSARTYRDEVLKMAKWCGDPIESEVVKCLSLTGE